MNSKSTARCTSASSRVRTSSRTSCLPPEYIIESYLVGLQLADAQDKARQEQLVERLRNLNKDYVVRHQYWMKAGLEPELGNALLKEAHDPAEAFYKLAFTELVPAVRAADADAVKAVTNKISSARRRRWRN